MISPTVLPDGKLDRASRVIDPDKDPVYPLWWILTYRDGTVKRQYEVRGESLIQTRFGLLPRTGILKIEIQNGAPWDHIAQWEINVPLGADAEIHYDGRITLSANVEICNRVKRSGQLILPGAQRVEYKMARSQCYTWGWYLRDSGIGEYLHVSVDGDDAKAWADHLCFV